MECTVVFVVGLVIVVILAIFLNLSLDDAKKAYLAALERLKVDPHNPNLREEVLSLGRKYAAKARGAGNATLFDEVALMNDINAACARAGTVEASKVIGGRPPLEERLASLDQLRAKQLITEQEYTERRTKILDEL
jgi:hypothetical protein